MTLPVVWAPSPAVRALVYVEDLFEDEALNGSDPAIPTLHLPPPTSRTQRRRRTVGRLLDHLRRMGASVALHGVAGLILLTATGACLTAGTWAWQAFQRLDDSHAELSRAVSTYAADFRTGPAGAETVARAVAGIGLGSAVDVAVLPDGAVSVTARRAGDFQEFRQTVQTIATAGGLAWTVVDLCAGIDCPRLFSARLTAEEIVARPAGAADRR